MVSSSARMPRRTQCVNTPIHTKMSVKPTNSSAARLRMPAMKPAIAAPSPAATQIVVHAS